MPSLSLKPTHKLITNYYRALAESGQLSLLYEGAVAGEQVYMSLFAD